MFAQFCECHVGYGLGGGSSRLPAAARTAIQHNCSSRCVAVLLPAPGRDYRRIMQADGGGTTRRLRSASREDAEVDELVEVIVGKLAATGYLDRPGATPAPLR